MAIPVARVHLAMAHAALPGLLPTPPKCKMLPLFPTPPCVAAAVLPKPLVMPSSADSDERWDARKTTNKPASAEPSASSSSGARSAVNSVRSGAGHGSPRKNATSSLPPKPGRADSVERWDAHKAASPASSSSSRTSSMVRSSKWPISSALRFDDGDSSSTGSNDVDTEEILWKPRALYAGPGFVAAAPGPGMLPMPTALLVPVA